MNKITKFLLFLCLTFALEINAMQPSQNLTTRLGTLKTGLKTLKFKLLNLQKKLGRLKQNLTTSRYAAFKEEDRDKLALYGNFADVKNLGYKTLIAQNHKYEGYGFKTANLEELKKISTFLNIDPLLTEMKEKYTITVPDFMGISSREVKRILSAIGINIDQKWNTLVTNHYPDHKIPNTYSTDFLKDLNTLANNIKDAFVKNASGATNILKNSLEPENWAQLTRIKNLNKRLMVRSTGREDTKELANAGGNESIANVEPTLEKIFTAMGKGATDNQWGTISSYFGEKSMKQRLGAKDPHLLDLPLVPVLIQEMIGEEQGGADENTPDKITRCGVLYTEETEGSLYKLTNGRTTSGITLIQAAYGHNEGVVNSIVPVDSFYVDASLKIYPIIRPKTFRLVPTFDNEQSTKGCVSRKDHKTSKIINSPALDYSMIKSLKILAKAVEQYYKMPMDIEYVIDVQHKTINLVQARPIVIAQTPEASYIKNIVQYDANSINIDDIIVASGGALRVISSQKQIITEKTINQALLTYQSSKDPEDVECILIEEQAPSTSHEAATFRGEGKPVVYLKNTGPIEKWKESNTKFIIDLQQTKIIKLDGPEANAQNLIDSGKALKGWTSYPISKTVSLTPEFALLPNIFLRSKSLSIHATILKTLINTTYKQKNLKSVADYYTKDVKSLDYWFFVEKIKNAESENDAKKAIVGLAFLIERQISKIPNKTIYGMSVDLLKKFVILYLANIYLNWKIVGFDITQQESRLKYLFQINFLEAILYGQRTPNIVNDFSLGSIIAIGEPERKWAIKKLQDKGLVNPKDETVQIMRIGKHALTEELANKWANFVSSSNSMDDDLRQALYIVIMACGSLGILELWLHTIFAEEYSPDKPVREMIESFFDQIFDPSGNVKPFVKKLNEYKRKIDALNLDGLASPSSFLKVWSDFKTNILNYFISDNFKDDFVNGVKIEKLIAISIMETLISKFDASIKDMEHSDKFEIVTSDRLKDIKETIDKYENDIPTEIKDNKNKIFTFSFMLYYYFELLRRWYDIVDNVTDAHEKIKNYQNKVNREALFYSLFASYGDPKEYNFGNKLLYLSKKTTDKEQIEPSIDFNVNMAMIGMDTNFNRAITQMKSLEDFFTFTHQSILVIIGKLYQTQIKQ